MQVTNKRKKQEGFAVIMTALTMLISIPLVGLAVDVSVLYMIHGKLQQAVDAAALAGAQALSQGSTISAQASSAQAAATTFFNANLQSGYWGISHVQFSSPTVDSTSTPNYRTVTTSATLSAPLYFLRVLGQSSTTIAASSQAGRRDVLMMLVLDRSSSMDDYPFQGSTPCVWMVQDATQFLNYFAPGRDMVGLVVFGSAVFTYTPTATFTTPDANGNTVASLIGQITCGGNTNTDEAMYQAYNQITTENIASRANVIVLMTDGRPNGFTGQYYCSGCSPKVNLLQGACTATSSPLKGEVEQWAGGPYATGETAGLSVEITSSVTPSGDGTAPSNTKNCAMDSNIAYAPPTDLKQMPSTDIHGNSITGQYSVNNPNAPYNSSACNLSVSSPQQIEICSVNGVDNMGITIRQNTVLQPTIYSIALEGNAPNDPPDTLLLRKLANDPTMQNDPSATAQLYWSQQNPGQTVGYFADAPNAGQLSAAFNSIAERIVVRLAR